MYVRLSRSVCSHQPLFDEEVLALPRFRKKSMPTDRHGDFPLTPFVTPFAGDRLGLVATEKRKEKKSVNSLTLFVTPFAGDRLGLVATEKKRKYPSIGSSFSSNN